MDEKRKVPEIRFAGFTDEWTVDKIANNIREYVEKKPANEVLPVLTSSRDGIIPQDEHFSHQQQHDITDYNVVPRGYCTYRNRSDDRKFTFNINKIVDRGIVSRFYPVFSVNQNSDTNFLIKYLNNNPHSIKDISILAVGTSQVVLSLSNLKQIDVFLPNKAEQIKIGKIFSSLDDAIYLQQQKLTYLQSLKQSLLQKMFPQAGARVPEIRFQGFTGEWEEQSLGELATFAKGKGYTKNDLTLQGTPIILYGRLYTKYETVIKEIDTFVKKKKDTFYSKGGEVIVPASGETADEIAVASVVKNPNVILGGDLNIIYPATKIDSTFLAISITHGKPHSDMANRAQGKSVVHLHNDDLAQIRLLYPTLDEQKMISSFFNNIDGYIKTHEAKIAKLQVIKQSLLAKMFV